MKHFYFIQIDTFMNRLNIFDGTDEMSMHIGEVYGHSYQKLMKSISSSGKSLFVDFNKISTWGTGTVKVLAAIKYKKMNSVCQTWLDLEKKLLKSPNDLNTYDKSINCSWLITANFGSYITLGFTFLNVMNFYLFEKVTKSPYYILTNSLYVIDSR